MASAVYNSFKKKVLQGLVAFGTDTIKMALMTSAYTPNIDTDVFYSDISTNESSGTGYSAGGATLANITVTQDNTNDLAYVDADDVTWATSTIANARYGVLYKSTGTGSTSALIAYIDFVTTRSSNGDTLVIQFDVAGVLKIT